MTNLDEIQRIDANLSGEESPAVRVSLRGECQAPDETLAKVRSVMKVVASNSSASWPTDAEWEALLPAWFVSYTKRHTTEQILADFRLCHWEAWLDTLKERDWDWWSSELLPNGLLIYLCAKSWPYQVGPLVYLMYACGATVVEVKDDAGD